MKPNRAQYRRKWVAAATKLQNTNHPNMDDDPIVDQHPNVELDQLIELLSNCILPDNSDPDNSDPEIDEEQSELSHKRFCGMKKTHGNHMWFTCVPDVVTCDPHVTTCDTHVDLLFLF